MTTIAPRGLARSAARLLFGATATPPAELARRWQASTRIVIAALSGIGDSVMATPLMAALREAKPDADLVILARPEFSPLISIRGARIIPLKLGDRPSLARALRTIRGLHAEFLFAAQPFNTLKHSLLAIASGSGSRLKTARSYAGEEWRDFSFLYSTLPPDTAGRHRIELNLDLLRAVGVEIPDGAYRPHVVVPASAREAAAGILPRASGGARLLAVHPGGLYAHKHWGVERYAQACRMIAAEADVRFVMVGSGPELAACAEIRAAAPELEWLDLAGRTDLPTTAGVLERVDLLLSNDTGVMHLATAVDTPVVAVFGATGPDRIGPYHDQARWVRRDPIQQVTSAEVAALVAARITGLRSWSLRD